jgi:hypothetical protein
MVGKSNRDVAQMVITHPNCRELTFVPQRINDFFPNLIGLSFSECGIAKLTGTELKDLSNLQSIMYLRGSLEKLPGKLFKPNPKLKQMLFHNNRISKVSWNLLNHLRDLITVNFFNNVCIQEAVNNNRTGVLQMVQNLRIRCPVDPGRPVNFVQERIVDQTQVELKMKMLRYESEKLNEELIKLKNICSVIES